MTLGLGAILAILASPWLLGAGVSSVFRSLREDGLPFFLGFSFIVGNVLLVSVMAWALCSENAAIIAHLPGPMAVGGVSLLGISWWRRRHATPQESKPKAPRTERLLASIILGLSLAFLADRAVLALRNPVIGTDEAHGWAARAKVLFETRGFRGAFADEMSEGDGTVPPFAQQREYPWWNVFLQLFTFEVAGRILHFENRFPIQAANLALVLFVFGALKRRARPLLGAALAALVAFSEPLSTSQSLAIADGMMALGFVATLEFLRRFRSSRSVGDAIGLGVALGFLLGTKRESLAALLALLVAIGLSLLPWFRGRGSPPTASSVGREPFRAFGLSALIFVPAFAAIGFGFAINHAYGFESDLFGASPTGRPAHQELISHFTSRLPTVASFLMHDFALSFSAAHGIPILFLGLFLLSAGSWRRDGIGVEGLAIVGFVLATALVFIGNTRDLAWQLEYAGVRVFSLPLPAMAWWIGTFLGQRDGQRPSNSGFFFAR